MEERQRNQYNKIMRRRIQDKAQDYLAILREEDKPKNENLEKLNEVVFMNHLSEGKQRKKAKDEKQASYKHANHMFKMLKAELEHEMHFCYYRVQRRERQGR